MKNNFLPVTLISLAALLVFATRVNAAMTFVHPGAMSSKDELDFVKAKIAAGTQPWSGAFQKMLPLATPYTKTTAPLDLGKATENDQKDDAKKAYANALAWYFTGNETYAKNAIAVFKVWANTFAGYRYADPLNPDSNQSQLDCAWIGAILGPAAEILRGYSGWVPADMAAVQNMFKTKFYPDLNLMSVWNGNVDLTQIDAMMNIAVFNEDEAEFNLGLARMARRDQAYFYLSTDPASYRFYGGLSDASWFKPAKWVDGLTQETCRDNDHHAQYALASALHAAEVAWHQGVDVYTPNEKRFREALELMSTQIWTGRMQGTCGNDTTTPDRFDTFEVGYNHYHNRKGIELPNTWKAITQEIRPKGQSDWNIFFETLTHGDLLISRPVSAIGNAPGTSGR